MIPTLSAESRLPDENWATRARYSFERADNVYIYTDSVELLDDEPPGSESSVP